MAFHETWFNKAKRRHLNQAMSLVTATTGDAIEVGSWEGRSTIEITNFFHPLVVTAVDHWKGDLGALENGIAEVAKQRDVFADFKENMDEQTRGNYVVFRDDWRNYDWAEHRYRFVFIDGQHTYDEVHGNILAILPLIESGGVIAGDDYLMSGVREAVQDTLLGHRDCGVKPSHDLWYWVKK